MIAVSVMGQQDDTPAIESSDPKAVNLLKNVSKKLHSANNYAADFTFTIAYPDEADVIKKGSLIQEGSRFYVDLEDQTMTSDGESVWTHHLELNELQITDAEESADGFNNPSDFLTIHEKGDFIFGILASYKRGKSNIKEIEFKPIERNSEFSKVRLVVNETTKEIEEVLTFFKNGSRYTLKVGDWKLGIATTDAVFTFDESKFPGLNVEDLRF